MAESGVSGDSSSSKTLMWMMVALFVGVGVLLGAGFFMAGRVVRAVGMQASTNRDTVRTPAGNFRMEKESEVGQGMPVYPNASLVLPGEDALAGAAKNMREGIIVVTYHTTDTRESVDNWYTQHLSHEYTRHDAGEKPLPAIFNEASVSENDIAFDAEHGQRLRIIALSLDSTGTKISMIKLDKPEQPATQ
jgi:hypothetical protein